MDEFTLAAAAEGGCGAALEWLAGPRRVRLGVSGGRCVGQVCGAGVGQVWGRCGRGVGGSWLGFGQRDLECGRCGGWWGGGIAGRRVYA